MQAEWFTLQHGIERGPFAQAQLANMAENGQLLPTDLVRKKDGDWLPAENFTEIFSPPRSAFNASTDYPQTGADATFVGYGKRGPSVGDYFQARFAIVGVLVAVAIVLAIGGLFVGLVLVAAF